MMSYIDFLKKIKMQVRVVLTKIDIYKLHKEI